LARGGEALRAGVHAVCGQNLGNAHEAAVQSESQPVLVIEHLLELRVPGTRFLERRAPEKRAWPGRAFDLHHHAAVAEFRRAHTPHYRRMRVDEVEITVGERRVGVFLETTHRAADRALEQHVIRAEIAEDLAARYPPAAVKRRHL